MVGDYEAGYAGPEATPVGVQLQPPMLTRKLRMNTNPIGNVVLVEAEVEADLPEPALTTGHRIIRPLAIRTNSLGGGRTIDGAAVEEEGPIQTIRRPILTPQDKATETTPKQITIFNLKTQISGTWLKASIKALVYNTPTATGNNSQKPSIKQLIVSLGQSDLL